MARSNAVGKLREIAERIADGNKDPRDALLDAVGDLSGQIVLHNLVLVATRAGNKYHPGTSILRTDNDLLEERFQGSIALVLAKGPGAFKDDNIAKFHGQTIEPGDWVLVKPSDGLELFIRQVPCRLFEDSLIKMRVNTPEIFW